MNKSEGTFITVETTINAPLQKVWDCWTDPQHIINWNFASDDWHSPNAENDLHSGGRFVYRMEAKDGSFGFDFTGTYDIVEEGVLIEYTMDDGRKATIKFIAENDTTRIVESFQAEQTNSLELQQNGWQAILNNFKKYVERAK